MSTEHLYQVPEADVLAVELTHSSRDYDTSLYNLGKGHDQFIIINPFITNKNIIYYIDQLPESTQCIVLEHKRQWIAKIFSKGWNYSVGYHTVKIVKPKLIWEKNPDLDQSMTFENTPIGVFEPESWDKNYKFIWYIDPKVNPLADKVWAISCHYEGLETRGTKDIGFVKPKLVWEKNPELDQLMTFENTPIGVFEPVIWNQCKFIWYIDPKVNPLADKVWAISCHYEGFADKDIKDMGFVKPKLIWKKNPDLDQLMTFENTPIGVFEPEPWDKNYKFIWYIDPKVNPLADKVWAISCYYEGLDHKGTKDMGFVRPKLIWEKNPDLDQSMTFENTPIGIFEPGPWDRYRFIWYIDPKVNPLANKVWAISCYYEGFADKDIKDMGFVRPKLIWEKNPELDQLMTFENTPIGVFEPGPWDRYRFIWYIDPKVNPLANKVWAISCYYEGLADKGIKDMGFVMPEVDITIKEDIPRMNIDIDQCYPPFWQISNECAFELTSDQHTLEDKVWVFKFTPRYREPIGWAWIGKIAPLITPIMDVIFISYNEKNAEENWKRVLEKAPHAKRVNGVRGIFNAHKAAAELATTDMFYVVDGDAFLVDDWVFDYNPILLDRNQTHVWYSINPTNGLVYGYGGVKLFPRILFNTTKEWTTLDLTTTIGSEFRIVDKVSNIAAFDTDAYSTWRSAFRECVKLYHNISKDKLDPVHRERMNAWLSSSQGDYCKWARLGAIHGVRYCKRNLNEYNILLKINDSQWLEEEFKRITKEIF